MKAKIVLCGLFTTFSAIRLCGQTTLNLKDKDDEYYTDIRHNNYLLFDFYRYTYRYIYSHDETEITGVQRGYSLFPVKIIR